MNEAERTRVIHEMLQSFLEDAEGDLESMTASEESGWEFTRYIFTSIDP